MYTLIIDGNYFAQRMRNALGLTFMETPEKDRIELLRSSAVTLSSEIEQLKRAISHVIICRDWSSWRKRETQVFPVESQKTEEEQSYKANRSKDLSYDAGKFYAAYDEFCDICMNELNIPVIKTPGAEADDIAAILSLVHAKNGAKTLLWSSDGDYKQLVTENTLLLKFPKKQIMKIHNNIEESVKTFDSIFSNTNDRFQVLVETFGQPNVLQITPMKSLFIKVVYGDAKDNVAPLFFWKSSTGKRTFKPSPAKIEKALKATGSQWEDLSRQLLYDKKWYTAFITELLKVCKQERDLSHTITVYEYNLRMKDLSPSAIPAEIVKAVINEFVIHKDKRAKINHAADTSSILQSFGLSSSQSFSSQFLQNEK